MITQTLIFLGITSTFTFFAAAGIISLIHIIGLPEEDENMEKDYVYMNDGTPVEYNEDDQE